MGSLWEMLRELKEMEWVDLTHTLTNDSPYWEGIPDGSVDLCHEVVSFAQMDLRIDTQKFPGQFGTHIDYPGHFIKGGALADAFSVKDTVFPLCVIDVSEKVKKNADYELTVDDILEYEKKYGRIPKGAFVAMRTDWSKRWPDGAALSNVGEDGVEHFPGWTMETLAFIYDERDAAANGHETLDTDASKEAAAAGDLACERYVLKMGKLQIELLCNLDRVAAAGAVLIAAWPRFEGATGLPVRVWALTE